MATSQAMLGMPPTSSSSGPSSSAAFNSISSAGMSQPEIENKEQQPTTMESPLDKFLGRFQVAFNAFKDLSSVPDYAVASDEANEVKKAMNNWLSRVADKLPQSANNGQESSSY